jgi:uncharacterized protein
MRRGNLMTMKLLQRVAPHVSKPGGAAVAYSGGVDSATVLACAHKLLGNEAVGILVSTELVPAGEIADAEETARRIGARLEVIKVNILANEQVASNPPDRCYNCKMTIMRAVSCRAAELGLSSVFDGSNADDARSHRPGRLALRELGIGSPLAEAGMGKKEVRQLARELGLKLADKHPSSCLASRVPYGTRLDPQLLRRIGAAEASLRPLVKGQLRVRVHGPIARIEVDPDDFHSIMARRQEVAELMHRQGFTYACLDLEGFRSGSLDLSLRTA